MSPCVCRDILISYSILFFFLVLFLFYIFATVDRARLKQNLDRQLPVLLEGDFLDRRDNVLLFGNPGSGKTHLLCALGHELIMKGRTVYFLPCVLLVQRALTHQKSYFERPVKSSNILP
ncbi:MAG: ATP-binding protein [Acidobacteria bacterium]|nr:ATP-binding protein [Acidobacteriota bacterium]